MWLSALGAGMQSFGNSMSEIKETERLEKKEAAAKKALEEAERKRIARRQVYQKQPDYTQGPPEVTKPTWFEAGFNADGEKVKDRRLTEPELFAIEQEEKINQASAERQQRKDEQEERRVNASIAASTASTRASNARAAKYKADGLAAPKGKDEAFLMDEMNRRLRDPGYRAALQAGDPNVLREISGPARIEQGIRSTLSSLGVPLEEMMKNDRNLQADLAKEQDPAVRAKIIEGWLRRADMAAASGRGQGFGMATPRQ